MTEQSGLDSEADMAFVSPDAVAELADRHIKCVFHFPDTQLVKKFPGTGLGNGISESTYAIHGVMSDSGMRSEVVPELWMRRIVPYMNASWFWCGVIIEVEHKAF